MVKSIFTSKRSLFVALATLALSLSSLNVAAEYTALSGTGGTGNEGYAKLVDNNDKTKWGFRMNNGEVAPYVIFKSDVPVVPSNYTIFIANDTNGSTGRNWQSWNVYAANFASDEEATADADGWVLVDKKENEVVPVEPFMPVEYLTSEGISTPYTYFKVEVTAIVESGEYMQMSEFFWGTAEEFYNNSLPGYTVIEGTKHDGSGECVDKMFDGNTGTKWYNGFNTGDDVYVIFQTTREIAPTYYCITTANDNYSYKGRNWLTWKVYGMAASSASDATRNADGWVLIDQRTDCRDMPDANYTEVFFTPTEGVTEKYSYFMIVIEAAVGGSFQVSEFYLGDAATLSLTKVDHYKSALIDLTKPMQKSLAADYTAAVESILSASDIYEMNERYLAAIAAQTPIKNSINAYDSYMNVVSALRSHYENHTCITGDARTLVGNYLDTEVAPCETYPNGSYSYIIANGLLDVEGINDEAIFVNMMLEKYASDLTEGAIDCTYEAIWGRAGFSNESFNELLDGNDQTKWCSGNGDYWVVFKASEPIAPTYYRLVTGNDTGGNPDRNWKSWKVYGANFGSREEVEEMCDDETVIRKSDKWTLIDEKVNVGRDQLPAANFASAFLYMSNPSDTPFEYFMIEISDPTGTMQMGEFSFGNTANFILTRQEFAEEFEDQDPSDLVACKKYIEDYKKALNKMQTTASIVELSNLYNTLSDLLDQITTSEELYNEFEFATEEIRAAMGYMAPATEAYWDAFINDDIEPNEEYKYGSYSYIMANLQLDNDEMAAYAQYLYDVAKAALEGGFCVIDGNMTTWGENENYFKLVDKDFTTKWGGEIQPGGSWVIFYTMEPTQPLFYKLTTGNDTQANYGRNWKDWQIYGGNFEKDTDATADAEGWVLLEDRKGVGQDRLPAENFVTVPFGFTEGVSEEYKYFKVVITAAYSGTSIQMTELEFGTEEEFEEIREGYLTELDDLNLAEDVVACDSLVKNYFDAWDGIMDAEDMEQAYQAYLTAINTYDKIQLSASMYDQYAQKVEAMKAAVATYEDSEELAVLKSYLNDEVEAGEQFPNGSAANVMAKHVLDNAGLLAEADFMSALAKAALLKGYGAGTDITAMVTNPSFADGAEGWNGEVFGYNYNAEYTMSAAEFCNEKSKFNVYQTLTGLKNGYYLVGMNGGFRSQGDIYADNYAAVLYANDNVTYIQSVNDDMIAKDDAVNRVNCWLENNISDKPIMSDNGEGTDTLGYVIWGVQSCCYAFQAGRYQNYVVAQVTDGTLTFGAKNEGTQNGGDWCGLGNTTIKFLGELDSEAAAEALDLTLASEAKIVNSLSEYEGFYETSDYKVKPFVNEAAYKTLKSNMESAPATGADKYAAVVSNSDCFKTIYDCKNAYVKSMAALLAVQDKWDAHAELMADADATAYDDATYAVLDGNMGQYTADEAIKAAEDLKAKYPCYIDLDATKAKGALEITETAPFEYVMKADGTRPNIGLNKVMYEALPEDQNIVAFEYKCSADLEGGTFYMAHPNLTTTDIIAYGNLPAANEWKKAYICVANGFGWGTGTDHWMRWDLATSGTFDISVRNMIIVTEAQMKAEGGEVINTGIDEIIIETEVPETFIYNVMGQRVSKDYKGITIQGGKKTLNK